MPAMPDASAPSRAVFARVGGIASDGDDEVVRRPSRPFTT